ncbi:MAG: helix-turn-helix domain-containing protein [Bacilli bacterium]|nr:helix-turn-helix domain-containing protein [Bacilli bacterium]
MYRTYKFRIYPNKEQEMFINKTLFNAKELCNEIKIKRAEYPNFKCKGWLYGINYL